MCVTSRHAWAPGLFLVLLPSEQSGSETRASSRSPWRHGSASILGTTRTVTRAPMLMYWAGLSQIASPRPRETRKVEIRPWIGLTYGVWYVGTQEVELERAGEKSAVDGSDPVCSFIHNIHHLGPRIFRACNS